MTFTGAWCVHVNYHMDAYVAVQGYFPSPTSFNQHTLPVDTNPTSVIERENIGDTTTHINKDIDCGLQLVSEPTQPTFLMMRILFSFGALFWGTIAYFVLSSPAKTLVCRQQ